SVGFLNAFGVFLEYCHAHQLSSRSEFGILWICSFAVGFVFATAPLAGVLVDKFGAPLLLLGGSFGALVATFMTSLSSAYYQLFLSQGVLLGGSMSFLFCPAVATVSKPFRKYRGLALGITVGRLLDRYLMRVWPGSGF
ncbi:hypothetical protein B0J12DRAFT_569151, partial [Macrophomina phaseolina]